MGWSALQSTELPDDAKLDMGFPTILGKDIPDYSPGMRIEMHEWLLEKLGLDHNCNVGDYLDMRCFAVVTSVHKEQVHGEDKVRVCMQIEKVAVESEMDEDEDDSK